MLNKQVEERIEHLRERDPKIAVTYARRQSSIAMLRGHLSPPLDPTMLEKEPFDEARQFIRENRMLLADIDESEALRNEKVFTDRRGYTHVTFQQMHGAAEVLGALLSVHYGPDAVVTLLKSSLVPEIDLPKRAKLSATKASDAALEHAGEGATFFKARKPVLAVVDRKALRKDRADKTNFLCWQLAVEMPFGSSEPGWIYLVDALDGDVLFRYPAACTSTGTGRYSGGGALNSEASGTTFRLRNTVTSAPWPEATRPAIRTYDDQGSTSFYLTDYSQDSGDTWDNGGVIPADREDDQRPEVDIHRYLGYVVDYFYQTHGYNGWDNAGSDARGHAHNEYLSNNAFWYSLPEQVYFADGDGVTRDFMCPLDTVTHEYAHGMKYYLNVLQIYDGESGALNEATSDLFGAFVARDYPADDPEPWVHSSQYRLDGTSGRNMIDPSRDAAGTVQYDATNNTTKYNSMANGYYPDHFSIRYTGTRDHHGVHINCPIVTHACYLMMAGGTHRLSGVTVNGIGVSPIEQMLYYVISTPGMLTNTSDFGDFRLAMITACQMLFPENLDYLAAVKSGFHAVGIGPDLYVRDRLADQGEEPGVLSCMSPDIIVRQAPADAAMLAQIADVTNGSLCEQIELGGGDHSVYFRIHNRGATPASGTFRLYISPVSTFPTPATWHEVGHYDFPDVASDGLWVPSAATQCITLSDTLISTLGTGHFCFIGIIESDADVAPDHMLIDNVMEFHDFISKSNNYAWRNVDIENIHPDTHGDFPMVEGEFQMGGFGRRMMRTLEIDTRALPADTQIHLWMETPKLWGVKAYEAKPVDSQVFLAKTAGVPRALPKAKTRERPLPLARLAETTDIAEFVPSDIRRHMRTWRALKLIPGKVIRLQGIGLGHKETTRVWFMMKLPHNTGTRDVGLAFREICKDRMLGQVNYLYRVREKIKRPVTKKKRREVAA